MPKPICARFSPKQRAAMMAKAAELGWKVPKEEALNVTRWCDGQDILLRQFKTWMNNNRMKQEAMQAGDGGVAAPPDPVEASGQLISCRGPRRMHDPHGEGTFGFFKVMVPGSYEERLQLPRHFGDYFGGEELLELQMDGDTENPWPVKVQVCGKNGRLHLKHGWQEFVQAKKILPGNFLTFTYNEASSVVAVKIFTPCGCRRANTILADDATGTSNVRS